MTIKKMFTVACLTAGLAHSAHAQAGRVFGSSEDAPGSYVAGIWVDPDGCQHWVMDLGIEGMMDSVLTRDGLPVCGGGVTGVSSPAVSKPLAANTSTAPVSGQSCGAIAGDMVFAQGTSNFTQAGYQEAQALAAQLNASGINGVSVLGYSASEGSENANQVLSNARAQVVANVLYQNGVTVIDAQGLGSSNSTNSAASAQSSRVELICQ